MLVSLSISNIVLIERLNLEFGAGLNILTGETGAGKSILLDALSMALGARSDTGLLRHGCDSASVVAEFNECPNSVKSILDDNGIECDGTLILRRTMGADGKSRAWINDTPVSVKTLKQIGDAIVEIHGQFANHTLLDPSTHRAALDEFARMHMRDYDKLLAAVKDAYNAYHTADTQLKNLREMLERAASEREFLEHNVAELRALNPQPGEEGELAARRAAMMNAEKNAAILSEAADAISPRGQSLDAAICAVAHILGRIKTDPNPYATQIERLFDAAEIISDVAGTLTPPDADMDDMDAIEERLFAIRAAARKHRVTPDELPQTYEKMAAQLNAIDNSDAELKKLESDVKKYRAAFDQYAEQLTAARDTAANAMRTALLTELPDLKLGQADFAVINNPGTPSMHGTDDILFMIKTNPGAPFAPLHKSASGGELARLMLAMRVVLAGNDNAHTFVFDEVDTGISGATASAVGLRLNKLANRSQALVITHSAQVAGYADRHYKILKTVKNNVTTTTVTEISGNDRLNEIARIISGEKITPESLATAKTLIHK